jgi:hypothetical protein
MPKRTNIPAPASAPTMRAESEVVREMLIAPIRRSFSIVAAMSAPRTPRSEGRTRPIRKAMTKT